MTGKSINEPDTQAPEQKEGEGPQGLPSINEPPGSQVVPPPEQPPPEGGEQPPPEEDEPLPSEDELVTMTRVQLEDMAERRGVDTAGCTNKGEVVERLRDHDRQRRRQRRR